MYNNISLWHRAKSDIEVVRVLLKASFQDELHLDIVAYHLQQAVEKLMKYQLEMHGVVPSRTHDLLVLADQFDKINLAVPQWIIDNAETFRDYATKTRYGTDLLASKRKLMELLKWIEAYLEENKPIETDEAGVKGIEEE